MSLGSTGRLVRALQRSALYQRCLKDCSLPKADIRESRIADESVINTAIALHTLPYLLSQNFSVVFWLKRSNQYFYLQKWLVLAVIAECQSKNSLVSITTRKFFPTVFSGNPPNFLIILIIHNLC